MKDLAGREMTPVERKVLKAYDGLCTLLKEPGLAPCLAANLKEAVASLHVAVSTLGLRYERPDDLHL